MKKFKSILLLLAVSTMVAFSAIFQSCDDEESGPTLREQMIGNFAGLLGFGESEPSSYFRMVFTDETAEYYLDEEATTPNIIGTWQISSDSIITAVFEFDISGEKYNQTYELNVDETLINIEGTFNTVGEGAGENNSNGTVVLARKTE